jgi:hypothetical protein
MRTFDFTPYYRSTVGFDRLFDLLDQSIRSDWPPYNIEKKGEDQYRITRLCRERNRIGPARGYAPGDGSEGSAA